LFLTNVSLVLFDLIPANDDGAMYHAAPLCSHQKKLDFTAWHSTLSDSDGTPRGVTRMTPDGTAGTQNFLGRIVGVGPSQEVAILAEGLNNPSGIDVYPGFMPPVGGIAMFFQVNSPVDVLITGPDGRRIGIDPNTSQFVNDYGDAGYDSNTAEPHIYGIRDPLPGSYDIATRGTGTGFYSIGTYAANLGTQAITQVRLTGIASPGSSSSHQFGLDQTGAVTVPDSDGDAFDDSVEGYVSTDPLDACPDDPGDGAWPLDVNNDGQVSVIGDVLNFRDRIGATPGAPNWWQRMDLSADGQITVVGDALKYLGQIGATCT